MFDQTLVEVFTTQEGVAVGRQNLKLLFAVDVGYFDDRNIEGAATQVKHRNLAIVLGLLVETERQRCSRWFVNDTFDFKPRNPARIFGGLALSVVEISGDCDHGFGHVLAQVVLGGLFHFAQHFSRHLRGRKLATTRFDPRVAVIGLDDGVRHQADVLLDLFLDKLPANQALDRKQRVGWVGHSLTLGGCAHEDLTILHVRNDGRRGAGALGVFDHTRLPAFHDGDAGVGGAEVDTDDLGHGLVLLK